MTIKVGSRVAYSVQFLRSIGESPTGELCHYRGVVKSIRTVWEHVIVTVGWDHERGGEMRVNVANLAIVGPNSRFANCG